MSYVSKYDVVSIRIQLECRNPVRFISTDLVVFLRRSTSGCVVESFVSVCNNHRRSSPRAKISRGVDMKIIATNRN